MKKNLLLIAILCFVFFLPVKAEELILKGSKANEKINGATLIRYTDQSALPNYLQFEKSSAPLISEMDKWMQTNLHLSADYSWVLLNADKDKIGFTHFRFQQTFKGIPVAGTMYIFHVRNEKIESISGLIYNDINIQATAIIFASDALNLALAKVNAKIYKWQIPAEEQHLKAITKNSAASYFPKGDLKIIKSASGYNLCYAFNIYAVEPMGRTMEYVDANSGKIILSHNLIETIGVNGTAHMKYSGVRTIQTDSVSSTLYHLRDATRGLGITTLDLQNSNNYAGAIDFNDTDNDWNNINAAGDEAATDAHFSSAMTYDYYWLKHGRNSIDNAGLSLNSYLHYNTNYANAFWDGTEMTYGDGNKTQGFLIMTGLDVCGHEITHGLTNFTANLGATSNGTSECDALNEGFSDIFGTAIEHYARPHQWDWIMGADISCNAAGVPDGAGLRTLSNPALSGAGSISGTQAQPVCYLGANWDTQGEPHNNNGPLIYWFYLLSTGNVANNITALGIDTAAEIAYRTLTVHLTPNATYNDTRFFSIVSSSELYGGCSVPTISITNAWNKVCVGAAYVASPATSSFVADVTSTCDTSLTVNFQNNSINGNSFVWELGDGTVSSIYNPTHHYAPGIYTVKLYTYGGTCGNDTSVNQAYIKVGPPKGPTTHGASICNAASVTLTATPLNVGDSINWFNSAVGGSIIASGNSFTTPVLNTTTTYYAEEKVAGQTLHVGPLDNTFGTGNNYTNTIRYMIFDCTSAINLQSVLVYAQGAGNRTIELRDAAGTVLQTATINIPNGTSRVNLNFAIPVGTNLQLGVSSTSSVNLYRNNGGAVYPYTNGPISITGNNGSPNFYYFFYDWILQGNDCYSQRTPSVVAVDTTGKSPALIINNKAQLQACAPQTFTLNANTGSGLTYQWFKNGAALSGEIDSALTVSTTGYYAVAVNVAGCNSADTSALDTVSIFTPPTITSSAAGSTNFCQGGSVTLNATSVATIYWSNGQSGNSISVNQSGNYVATAADNHGCKTSAAPLFVNVNPNPIILVVPMAPTVFCQGGSVQLYASGSNTNYTWSNAQIGNTITVNQSGTYYASSTNSLGCSGSSTLVTVSVTPSPTAKIAVASNTTGTVVFANNSTGANNYSWTFGDGNSSNSTTPSNTYVASGTYQVILKATSGIGCTDADTMMVTVDISGIAELLQSKGIMVYPNPVTEQLHLQFTHQAYTGSLILYNLLSQKITEINMLNKTMLDIPMSDLANGIYLVQLKNETENLSFKIQKQ